MQWEFQPPCWHVCLPCRGSCIQVQSGSLFTQWRLHWGHCVYWAEVTTWIFIDHTNAYCYYILNKGTYLELHLSQLTAWMCFFPERKESYRLTIDSNQSNNKISCHVCFIETFQSQIAFGSVKQPLLLCSGQKQHCDNQISTFCFLSWVHLISRHMI